MKILFENWRKYLVEDVDPHAKTKVAKPKKEPETDEYESPYEYEETEGDSKEKYFGLNPDNIRCIRDLRNSEVGVVPTKWVKPADFYKCMEQKGYTKLGAGSFRAVLEIPEKPELVLKIVGPAAASDPWKYKSMEMNKKEAQASFQTASDLIPKVYDSAKDYFWIISEKVTTIDTWKEMQEYFPVWNDLLDDDLFKSYDSLDFSELFYDLIKKNVDNNKLESMIAKELRALQYVPDEEAVIMEKAASLADKLINKSMFANIRDLLAQFKLPTWDIRPHNVGYAIRAGSKEFVILDPGFGLDQLADLAPEKEQEPESTPFKGKSEPDEPEIETTAGKMAKLSENWRLFVENTEIKGPYEYLMALELAEEGLSPDSYETSPDAERIWAKFMKKNDYGVKKEVKDEHEDKDETNPFNFVFFKPNTTTLDKYEDNITRKEVESEEKGGFDPEKEEEFEYFDPETADWDEIDELEEQTEPYQRFSRGTYAKFIGKLANQGKNKYNAGGRMKKASNKHLKSGPLGG